MVSLAKWFSVRLWTKWFWVRVQLQSLRMIISNIGTTSYKLPKRLAKLLLPLSKNQYTINSTKIFMSFIKHQKDGFIWRYVSLNTTIEVILKRIYDNSKIITLITKKEMRELILVCVKGIHFTFDCKTYVPTNGLAMGSPICPVLSGIFMAELENNLIHTIRRWHDLFDKKWLNWLPNFSIE